MLEFVLDRHLLVLPFVHIVELQELVLRQQWHWRPAEGLAATDRQSEVLVLLVQPEWGQIREVVALVAQRSQQPDKAEVQVLFAHNWPTTNSLDHLRIAIGPIHQKTGLQSKDLFLWHAIDLFAVKSQQNLTQMVYRHLADLIH